MSVSIRIPTPLRAYTEGQSVVEVSGDTVDLTFYGWIFQIGVFLILMAIGTLFFKKGED